MTLSANEKQVGGAHYKGHAYQHWDFATDLKLPYVVAAAAKYPARWRDKGGRVDLEKTIHYLEKAKELALPGVEATHDNLSNLERYIAQFPAMEGEAIFDTVMGDYDRATVTINMILNDAA